MTREPGVGVGIAAAREECKWYVTSDRGEEGEFTVKIDALRKKLTVGGNLVKELRDYALSSRELDPAMSSPNDRRLLCLLFLSLIAIVNATICGERVCTSNLQNPCGPNMTATAPSSFSVIFTTNYGNFTADCFRDRAPAWIDRLYNLVRNGYYADDYFFRVVNRTATPTRGPFGIVQFGTNGIPAISKYYNDSNPACYQNCGIILPQPPYMEYKKNVTNAAGTLSWSTEYNTTTNTTWNATAELFINTIDNPNLDKSLFIPICTISPEGMKVVTSFPSFGEVAELGGPGPSIEKMYAVGNPYIESNASWSNMARTFDVFIKPSGGLAVRHGVSLALNLLICLILPIHLL